MAEIEFEAEDQLMEWQRKREEEFSHFVEEYGIRTCLAYIKNVGNVRRPLVLVRGRPITVEQAKQLITGEEPLFTEVPEGKEGRGCFGCSFDPRHGRGSLKNIFYRSGYPWLSTWVYSDGTIGGNLLAAKYPYWNEMLLPYLHLGKKYPFLDLVISYTTFNEGPCYFCVNDEQMPTMCRCRDCEPYLDRVVKYSRDWKYNPNPDFEELYFRAWDTDHVWSDAGNHVAITIWVHGRTDILFGEEAKEKFNEYNQLYCAPEYDFMFCSGLYNVDRNCICSKSFVEDCFESIGKPRSLCDEYVNRGFISPFREDATVVTKEWVTRQYNAFIKK